MIRLSQEERAALDALKERSGLSRSDVVRMLLRRELIHPTIGRERIDPSVRASITNWPSKYRLEGTPEETSWPDLFARFGSPGPFLGARHHPGWSPCVCMPCTRSLRSVRAITALVFECTSVRLEALKLAATALGDLVGFVHTVEDPSHHVRVVLPLSRHATPGEHADMLDRVSRLVRKGGLRVTPESEEVTRFWTVPGVIPGEPYASSVLEGEKRFSPQSTPKLGGR